MKRLLTMTLMFVILYKEYNRKTTTFFVAGKTVTII